MQIISSKLNTQNNNMKRFLNIILFLFAFASLSFGQSVNPESFPAITNKTAAQGKYLYTNTGAEGKIRVDSIGVWFAPPITPAPLAWYPIGNTAAPSDFLGTINAAALRLRTNNTERISILATGQVGINKTTPTRQLDVVGDFEAIAGGVFHKVNAVINTTIFPNQHFAGDYHSDSGAETYNGVDAFKGNPTAFLRSKNVNTNEETIISVRPENITLTAQDATFLNTQFNVFPKIITTRFNDYSLNLNQIGLRYEFDAASNGYTFPNNNAAGTLTNDGAGNLTWSGGSADKNFAETDLTANGDRTHDFANFGLNIKNISGASKGQIVFDNSGGQGGAFGFGWNQAGLTPYDVTTTTNNAYGLWGASTAGDSRVFVQKGSSIGLFLTDDLTLNKQNSGLYTSGSNSGRLDIYHENSGATKRIRLSGRTFTVTEDIFTEAIKADFFSKKVTLGLDSTALTIIPPKVTNATKMLVRKSNGTIGEQSITAVAAQDTLAIGVEKKLFKLYDGRQVYGQIWEFTTNFGNGTTNVLVTSGIASVVDAAFFRYSGAVEFLQNNYNYTIAVTSGQMQLLINQAPVGGTTKVRVWVEYTKT